MNQLRLWHVHIQNANLSHFPTLKEMGMRPERKTEFADQLVNCLMNFRFVSKISNPMNIYLKHFLHHFTQTLTKPPLISKWNLIDLQERTDLKAKYVEMNLGDFYWKYLDQDKYPNLRKIMASTVQWHFSAQLICVNNFFLKWVS